VEGDIQPQLELLRVCLDGLSRGRKLDSIQGRGRELTEEPRKTVEEESKTASRSLEVSFPEYAQLNRFDSAAIDISAFITE
jgi:hypothetical protein